VSLRITSVCVEPFGKEIQTFPQPHPLKVHPSAVLISMDVISLKVSNFNLLRQKCELTPLSTIVPSLDFGTLRLFVTDTISEVQNNAKRFLLDV